ncbi:fatty acyl-AMP ligase [Amycolatopsis sp. cg5]|uniref:fatty acyl-AMP ligase n=1 Tax=Amycolatopsis sp. cg5 TaxID=3238802 RepID=UPI0035256FF9
MPESEPVAVLTAFHDLVENQPSRPLFTFVDDLGHDELTITAGELAASAEGVAAALRDWGLTPGDRVALVYPPSPDFLSALTGCLIAGVVPVPVHPPRPFRLKPDLAGFGNVIDGCGARAALTNTAYDRSRTLGSVTSMLSRDTPRWPKVKWYRTDTIAPARVLAHDWHEPECADEPALLQYTSGSTSSPKGVVVTHRNLAHEVFANARDLGLGDGTRAVSWLPQYHDFGLISMIISTLAGNGHSWLMAPLTFLQRPAVWFEVMSRVGATHVAAPNFAFELAVRKTTPEMRKRWELSTLRSVLSAAEPIRPSTVDNFFAAFSVSGLRPETFCPAYGLAEHTVSVTMGGQSRLWVDKIALEKGIVLPRPGEDGVEYIGCGAMTKDGGRLLIVDPDTRRRCAPDRVGEIWIDSPTKALGYWGAEAETAATFRARCADEPGEFLRTGDLGFVHDGELYLTSRLKDLIITHGHNVYPIDLEESVRDCHPQVRPGGLAAFGVPGDDDERVVIFVETRKDRVSPAEITDIADTVSALIHEDHQLGCHAVVVGKPGLVLKTTSGKVRRAACRSAYLAGAFDGTVFEAAQGSRTILP